MDETHERLLRFVAVQAALATAAVHLIWALPRLGDPVDLRPYLFVPSALLLLAVTVAVFRGYRYRRLHAFALGILGAYFVGFVIWEGINVGAALSSEPLAIVAKVAEVLGLVAFAGLYWLHHPDRLGSDQSELWNDPDETAADQ
ncbi:hypothetical protein ACNS7O_06670 [Haloferacaceae archaeon DSL9]